MSGCLNTLVAASALPSLGMHGPHLSKPRAAQTMPVTCEASSKAAHRAQALERCHHRARHRPRHAASKEPLL